MFKRSPDVTIGENYLHRWHVIPRNRYFNIYLHKFLSSDDDRAHHDHPWYSVSFLLKGRAVELSKKRARRVIPWLWPVFRRATFSHRIELIEGPVWTLFITGPKVRSWGFHCPKGWRHWSKFTTEDGLGVGRGCD